MMGLIGVGNKPMVGMTVAFALQKEQVPVDGHVLISEGFYHGGDPIYFTGIG